ncbi:hypothetical protein BX600DRAFT_245148 [Xylariales sp. PMI_506]|nr:hypothetical protein BX600DRAFT_245148 [Xylariales sp. PMI_506]
MKYGEYFEGQSVPRWSLHNIDYNSLKQQIKLHTTKGQATAMVIPGQVDIALQRFENNFYQELCNQHNRVDLFVASKADEISRRIKHLSALVNVLILKCAGPRGVTYKRQKKLVKYQQQLDECGRDIGDLQRFVGAQAEAFRKILKKYRKWTGSTTLSSRFNEHVLGDFKSFTKRDFVPLQLQYRELLPMLQATTQEIASSPIERPESSATLIGSQAARSPPSVVGSPRTPFTPIGDTQPEARGWNEYDNGSEAGEESYYIELDPDAADGFPGLETVRNILGAPVKKLRGLFSSSSNGDIASEHQSLLHGAAVQQPDYFAIRQSAQTTDNEATEDEDASSVDFPFYGYSTHYAALPSVEQQRVARYKEIVLHRSMVLSYLISIVLLVVASVLIATGRHKLRLEVDAGVCLAVVVSLFAGCTGFGSMMYRQDKLGLMYQVTVWFTFVAICLLNAMLLVLVAGL